MIRYVSAEYQKLTRTFTKRLVFFAPIATMLLSIALGVGAFFQRGSFNWWYTTILPSTIALICCGVINKDSKKLNYGAILSLPVSFKKIWYAKIYVCIIFHIITSSIFFIGVTIGGLFFGQTISILDSIYGSLIIIITMAWQIPLCLFLAEKFGLFITVILSLLGNITGVILAAGESFIWQIPFSITSRLMCPIFHILPNGLAVPKDSPLLDKSVILPGIIISIILFCLVLIFTSKIFSRKEVI